MNAESVYLLGIESSCDETSAAVTINSTVLSNLIASQKVHELYGGVVPELASRAHQKNIIPVVDQALKQAGIAKEQLHGIAFTAGPGLIGSLMVGSSFAKAIALALNIPLIAVNHMQAHVLALFARQKDQERNLPDFPFLCLTVSGGHTQIVLVEDYFRMRIVGQTQDDAAGEAFDKIAKIMGLPYPGGPLIDRMASEGNPTAFSFPKTRVDNLDFSFSGLKTSVLYFLRKQVEHNKNFIEENKNDLCASVQHTILSMLMEKLLKAAGQFRIKRLALAGGVSANSGLRKAMNDLGPGYEIFIPPFEFCTDNAAMIAVAGYFKFINGEFNDQKTAPFARFSGF